MPNAVYLDGTTTLKNGQNETTGALHAAPGRVTPVSSREGQTKRRNVQSEVRRKASTGAPEPYTHLYVPQPMKLPQCTKLP